MVDIEAEAVLRLVRNPEGTYSETDGNYSVTFDRKMASGKLEILPEEWQLLGIKPSRTFSIVPTPCTGIRFVGVDGRLTCRYLTAEPRP